MDTLWNRFKTRWKRKERSCLSVKRRSYHNDRRALQGQAVVQWNIERKKKRTQDEKSKHQESSQKSQFGVRSIMIWQKKLQGSLVFRQANTEKTIKNRGKGTETTIKRTEMNISKATITRKQRRMRRISEIAHDMTPADCSLDFEGISSPQSSAITARKVLDL